MKEEVCLFVHDFRSKAKLTSWMLKQNPIKVASFEIEKIILLDQLFQKEISWMASVLNIQIVLFIIGIKNRRNTLHLHVLKQSLVTLIGVLKI